MSELEERLNTLLSNPQLMQQIASMAQAMGTSPTPEQPEHREEPAAPAAAFDPAMLQTIQAIGQAGVDSNQKALLQALSPFLSGHRVQKLERAMQAAKLAGAASAFLNAGGLQMLTRR